MNSGYPWLTVYADHSFCVKVVATDFLVGPTILWSCALLPH